MHQQLLRMLIELAVDKGLNDINTDLKRAVRNLTDLGDYFAKGSFQKDFFKIARQMLSNEDSPYYELVSEVVNNVDPYIIKNFGINIGLNSWTNGANQIRNIEKEKGFNVPWVIVFDLENKAENSLSKTEILDIIQQGKEIGIYSYMFFVGNNNEYMDELLDIVKQNSECAFIIYSYPELLTKDNTSKLREYGNAIVSVYMDPFNAQPEFEHAIKILLDNKCLFGSYFNYNDDNANMILDDSWVRYIEELHCMFAFLIKSKNCNNENSEKISAHIKEAKTNQKYPVFLIDFYEDIMHIDRNISTESCFIKILQDGTIVFSEETLTTEYNIRNNCILEILSLLAKSNIY